MDAQGTDLGRGENPLPAEGSYSMAGMVDQYLSFPTLRRGDIVEGVIVSLDPKEVLVDIGGKTEGVVTSRDLERLDPAFLKSLRVGDEVVAYVVRPEGQDGNVVLSLSRAHQEREWKEVEKKQRSGETIEVPVVDANRGGLIVSLGRLRGFVPASQLGHDHRSPRHRTGKATEEIPWKGIVGETIQVKVLEVDRERNRLIVSEQAAEQEDRRFQKEQLLQELKEGDRRRGIVRSLCDFGAFVDLGGADGLVHLSELSWKRVQHPSEVVQVGDEVEVCVLNVDRERQRIGLSLRRLQPEPWATAAQKYQVGQVVEATVTRLTDFGAFALLEGGIEGLIHVSELASHRVEHPRQVVKEGDVVQVRILRIEPERRRLGLSLRQAAEDYAEVDWDVEEFAEKPIPEDATHTAPTEEEGPEVEFADKTEQARAEGQGEECPTGGKTSLPSGNSDEGSAPGQPLRVIADR
ncbi:MAG: 30S ribosomal protein S1 [Anaerolineae bacterium]